MVPPLVPSVSLAIAAHLLDPLYEILYTVIIVSSRVAAVQSIPSGLVNILPIRAPSITLDPHAIYTLFPYFISIIVLMSIGVSFHVIPALLVLRGPNSPPLVPPASHKLSPYKIVLMNSKPVV